MVSGRWSPPFGACVLFPSPSLRLHDRVVCCGVVRGLLAGVVRVPGKCRHSRVARCCVSVGGAVAGGAGGVRVVLAMQNLTTQEVYDNGQRRKRHFNQGAWSADSCGPRVCYEYETRRHRLDFTPDLHTNL